MQKQLKKFLRIASVFGIVLLWIFILNEVSRYGADQRTETIIIYRKNNATLLNGVAAKLNTTPGSSTLKPAVKKADPIVKNVKVNPTVPSIRRLEILMQTAFPTYESNTKTQHKYKDYDISNPTISYLKDSSNSYTVSIGSLICFREGTDISATTFTNSGQCVCRGDWWGKWCSFPIGFKTSALSGVDKDKVAMRDKPRRIIMGTPFNMEFEMLEARVAELADSVELFVITESNYTAYGDAKPRKLLNRLRQGYLLHLQDKIVYVALNYFPSNGRIDGWVADDLPRHELGLTGVMKQINDTRTDDLFIISDTDEIPSREAVLFLKMHNGYPEPFGFYLKWTTYGFYWKGGKGNTPIMAGSSIGMLNEVFHYRAAHVRNPQGYIPYHPDLVNAWKNRGNVYKQWKLGRDNSHVGWHCSWCFSPQMALIKLVSAQNGDFPRWGDHEKNLDIKYLKTLRAKGQWFDKSQMAFIDATVPGYAPKYLIENKNKYPYLMRNVYKEELNL